MAKVMTVSQIKRQFESEWVLIGNPETNQNLEVRAGKVLWHSKDRDEVYRKAIELRPRRFAILYTGRITTVILQSAAAEGLRYEDQELRCCSVHA